MILMLPTGMISSKFWPRLDLELTPIWQAVISLKFSCRATSETDAPWHERRRMACTNRWTQCLDVTQKMGQKSWFSTKYTMRWIIFYNKMSKFLFELQFCEFFQSLCKHFIFPSWKITLSVLKYPGATSFTATWCSGTSSYHIYDQNLVWVCFDIKVPKCFRILLSFWLSLLFSYNL